MTTETSAKAIEAAMRAKMVMKRELRRIKIDSVVQDGSWETA
jgi:hypothetical protein